MKALVYEGPQSLAFREVPDPVPGGGDAAIRVEAVGICGSDMHAYLGHDPRRPAPLILGHEAAGQVEGGARVTVNPLVPCGACPACKEGRHNLCPQRQIISMPPREGAFAERLAMPRGNLVEIPSGVPAWKAALAEPIACGWHAVALADRLLDGIAGRTAAVLGGGAIGLGAALVLLHHGADEVWIGETSALRRPVLERAGPFRVFDSSADLPDVAPDLVIDAVGIPATRALASRWVRPGGAIAHIGLGHGEGGLDTRRMTLQEITFVGTYTYTAPEFRATAEAIFAGDLGSLDWVELRPLAEGGQAFADLLAGKVASPKIVLTP